VRGVGNPPNGIGSVRPSVSTEQSTQVLDCVLSASVV
jgi:hypothetical protein